MIRILGGRVEDLYQGWDVERKYSLLARMGLAKTDRAEGVDGPPLFRGLAISKYEKPNRGAQGLSVERPKGLYIPQASFLASLHSQQQWS